MISIALSDAVDVYSDWVDACDSVAKEAAGVPEGDDDLDDADRGVRRKAPAENLADIDDEEEIDPEADFDDDD